MPNQTMDLSGVYRITVQGQLNGDWANYFEDLEVLPAVDKDGKPITMVTGQLTDQAALQGTLQKLYALGLPLVSVEKLEQKT
jgi:hypothetical protein